MKINYNSKRRDPEIDRQVKVNYAPAKRVLNKFKWRLTLLIILSPFIYFAGKLILGILIAPASGFVKLDSQTYQAPINSIATQVNIELGQKVKANEILVVLQDPNLEESISKTMKDLQDLKTKTIMDDDLKVNYFKKQLILAENSVRYYGERYKNIDYLFKNQAATINEKKTSLLQLNNAKSILYDMELNLDTLKYDRNSHKKDLNLKPEYIALASKLEKLKEERVELVIKAKNNGVVTEAKIKTGDVLFRGDKVTSIALSENQTIITYVKTSKIELIKDGQLANIKFPSGIKIKAEIQSDFASTSRLPESLITPMLGRQRMILVRLVPLEELPSDERIDGLPVSVTFMTETQNIIDKVTQLISQYM